MLVSLRPASVRRRGLIQDSLVGKVISSSLQATALQGQLSRLAVLRPGAVMRSGLIKTVSGPCFNLKVFQTANDGEQPEHPRPRR